MPTIRVDAFEDILVIHFGVDGNRINAYTLASTLTNIADAAKAANAFVNPGYDVEVVVETLGGGSFKATIRTIYREAANLFSRETLRTIVIGMLTTFIFEHTLATDPATKVEVKSSEVIVQHGDTKLVIPRDVHEAAEEAAKSPQFRKGVTEALRAVDSDSTVKWLGFSPHVIEGPPLLEIPRERFGVLPQLMENEGATERDMFERTNLQILRAILERSKRKWEFSWHGVKISAPVLDGKFYDDFFAHRITIAPGDALRVRLRIRQRRNPDTGVFINESYEIVEVLEHVGGSHQRRLGPREGL